MQTNTKTKDSNENQYIYPLADQLISGLKDCDIEICVEVLSDTERAMLQEVLLVLKVYREIKDDSETNKIIMKVLALMQDISLRNQIKAKQNKPFKKWTKLPLNK